MAYQLRIRIDLGEQEILDGCAGQPAAERQRIPRFAGARRKTVAGQIVPKFQLTTRFDTGRGKGLCLGHMHVPPRLCVKTRQRRPRAPPPTRSWEQISYML